MILRSVKGIKRGIGTIRQDVNVSVKGTNRVEIKGFQEIDSMPTVIQKEIESKKDSKPEEVINESNEENIKNN